MRIGLMFLLFVFFTFINKSVAQQINPPGTTWLRDNIYIDETPMLNVHYREYEHMMRTIAKFNMDTFLQLVNSAPYFGYNMSNFFETFKNITPQGDSAIYILNQAASVSWKNGIDYKTYLNKPTYNFYPLINISYDVAVKFCEWRTAMVQLVYSADATEEDRKKHHKKIKYRLATKEEWEYALKKFAGNKNLCIRKPKHNETLPNLKGKTGCINLTNLSEMVVEKTVVKGYNWKNADYKYNLNTTIESKSPADWITFRCVCEVED